MSKFSQPLHVRIILIFIFLLPTYRFVLLATPFPKNFVALIKQIFTRFFRIFAIIYSNHYIKLEQVAGVSHLNTSFKHFMYFVWEFDLVSNSELDALKDIVCEIRNRYQSSASRK